MVFSIRAHTSLGGQGERVVESAGEGGCGGEVLSAEVVPRLASQVDWRAGNVFDRAALDKVMPSSTAVVSTLGILLESDYKNDGLVSPLGVLRGIVDHALGSKGNPLDPKRKTYEKFNRDAGKQHSPALLPPTSPSCLGPS